MVPLPSALFIPPTASVELTDRHGQPLREVAPTDLVTRATSLAEIPQPLIEATLAAEDRRFWTHSGVDWRASVRAAWQLARHRRVISGGSTITQQLLKLAQPRPRTFRTKLIEALQAFRLEQVWTKQQILEAYLNRLDYGNLRRGCASASVFYFGCAPADLSLAEAALLAGLPQAPSRLNPHAHFTRAKRRQEWILDRMQAAGWLTAADALRAKAMPVRLRPAQRAFAAPHFVDLVLRQQRPQLEAHTGGAVATTLDLAVQHHAEDVLRQQLAGLGRSQVRHGAVVVLDVPTGDVLALVGSGDFFSPDAGQVNGAWAPRSAGSSLKPFTYLLALERGANAATLLADVPTEFTTPTGLFAPVNYDRTYRGPVRLREALASSLNVPAVRLLHELGGAPPLLDLLRTCGLSTLEQPAGFYGLGLTIGNAEVRLLELANAYACLARLGEFRPFRLLSTHEPALTRPSGTLSHPMGEGRGEGPYTLSRPSGTLSHPMGEGRGEGPGTFDRLFNPDAAWLIADILSDNNARAPAFGLDSPLRFDFPAACKTGTSSDFRDNWAFAYTPEFVVGVWIGNFDAAPMHQVSGVSGAAPVMHAILADLHERFGTTWYRTPDDLVELPVHRLTGRRETAAGRDSLREKFLPRALPESEAPAGEDSHGCIRLPLESTRWIESSHNWLGPRLVVAEGSERAAEVGASPATAVCVEQPVPGSVYVLDPDLPDHGGWLLLLAQAHGGVIWTSPTLQIELRAGRAWARLTQGRHVIEAHDAATGATAETWIQVRRL